MQSGWAGRRSESAANEWPEIRAFMVMGEGVLADATAPENAWEKNRLMEAVRRAPCVAHSLKPTHCVECIKLLIA